MKITYLGYKKSKWKMKIVLCIYTKMIKKKLSSSVTLYFPLLCLIVKSDQIIDDTNFKRAKGIDIKTNSPEKAEFDSQKHIKLDLVEMVNKFDTK